MQRKHLEGCNICHMEQHLRGQAGLAGGAQATQVLELGRSVPVISYSVPHRQQASASHSFSLSSLRLRSPTPSSFIQKAFIDLVSYFFWRLLRSLTFNWARRTPPLDRSRCTRDFCCSGCIATFAPHSTTSIAHTDDASRSPKAAQGSACRKSIRRYVYLCREDSTSP